MVQSLLARRNMKTAKEIDALLKPERRRKRRAGFALLLLAASVAAVVYGYWRTDQDRQRAEASRQRALDQYAARMMPLIRAWGYHCSQIAHVNPKGVDVYGEVYLVFCVEGTRLRWTTHSTG